VDNFIQAQLGNNAISAASFPIFEAEGDQKCENLRAQPEDELF